ncbi:hypothetical protein ASE74_23985 [Pedobacter sp. Leaf216]|uniref:hypothetical protein n=1 Tax=Pedobacter sp. Leaf216 TaxID=1735684 RepID=UPI0006F92A00|nr:hypothetical protein [Pedobacter sp. Leaf216]KQM68538.1 hypothetical protein ASE74_23985 [Pedobacter sp. Leaf216]
MFYKIYLENNDLIIETFFLKEKIAIDSIDDIIIFYNRGFNKHKLYTYFNKPVQYELTRKSWFYQILFEIFLVFNTEKFRIYRLYENEVIALMFSLLRPYLSTLTETKDLDLAHSFTWMTYDEGGQFKQMKLVYSRDGLGLKRVMLKHKILLEK